MKQLLLNDKFMLFFIIINTILIYLNGLVTDNAWLVIGDNVFTIVFLIEACVKIYTYGWRGYWKDGWNKFDFIVVLLALPSLLCLLVEDCTSTNFFLVFRTFRVFKSFLLFRFVPNIAKILNGIKLAMKSSLLVSVAYMVFLIVVSTMTSALFGDYAPQYFDTPLRSLYSVFRLFTVEGWYEMPDAVVANGGAAMGVFARIYFAILLFSGGIIGMSLINSIFVDAMVSDNNDEVLEKLNRIEDELKQINKKQ